MAGDPHSDCHCDATACECKRRGPVYVVSADYSRPVPDRTNDLLTENISLRRELVAAKAELFRLRNQRR